VGVSAVDGAWGLAAIGILVAGLILWSIRRALAGSRHRLRPLAGIDALADAVGRATELGRPLLFIAGTRDMDNVQTLAALNVLGRVAGMCAVHGCRMIVPTNRSLVLSAARETCRQAYDSAGKGDDWHDEMVQYVTDDQFGFVSRVDGLIAREKPGACVLMGAYSAESLLLAEAGSQVGAVQVAGTAMPLQLPFFIAACDHTLMGEELYAAGAYLGEDPAMLGSLRGQDLGKRLAIVLLVGGALLATSARIWDLPLLDAAADTLRALLGGG